MGYNDHMAQLASVFILILALTAGFAEQRPAAPSSLDPSLNAIAWCSADCAY